MPPRGVKSAKRTRQYEHIKESAEDRGETADRAEEIAARTVNKQRRQAGEAQGARQAPSKGTGTRTSARKRTAKKRTAEKRTARTSPRKAASKKR